MKREFTIIVATLLVVLIVSLSFLNVPLAVSQGNTDGALEKLRQLHGEVSDLPDSAFKNSHSADGHRKALANKINAVIHQVEAGAINGAINKLENDLINAVTNWVTEEYRDGLIDKIEYIIDLLKGIEPPPPPWPKPDFAITASPDSLTIQLGNEDTTTIMVISLMGFNKPVDLTVTSASIEGVTLTLDPPRVTPPPDGHVNSTLTVKVDAAATVGTYTVEVTGTWDAIERGVEISLEITASPPPPPPPSPKPDFTIKAFPNTLTIEQGDSDESTIVLMSIEGFNSPVDLEIVSDPIDEVTLTLDPAQVTPPPNGYATSTLSVEVGISAAVGTYTIKANGTSGSLEHSVEISLKITEMHPPQPKPKFSMAAFPKSLTIQQGGSDESTIAVISVRGFSGTVGLAVVSALSGVTFALDPSQVVLLPNSYNTSTLSVKVDTTAPTGSYTVRVEGTSGILEDYVDISLEITALPPPPPPPPPPQPRIKIFSVLRVPETPNYDEDVTVIAQVESVGSPIDRVILSYSINAIDWINVTMTLSEALYSKAIPCQPYRTTVSYKVYANNTAGKTDVSEAYSYVVIDSRAPTISDVERSPISPNYNETVTVLASVTEPAGASGVKLVLLELMADSVQKVIPMTTESEEYKGIIDELPFGTVVKYRILASDEADNHAVSDEGSYIVGDEFPPKIEISSPAPDSYLKSSADVVVFADDDNFERAELTINAVKVAEWTSGGEHTFTWNTNTTASPDGTYLVELSAKDKAGNLVEESLSVTVDNTVPTALINTPLQGSFLRLSVLVNVTGSDANFDRMELRIGDTSVKTWTTAGSQIYEWKTNGIYSDGAHTVSLTVSDKAGNTKQIQVSVVVDNTAPTIEIPSWEPRTPSAQEEVNVTVKISDNPMGSGVKSATLWYRNGTVRDWQQVLMIAVGENWTGTIPGQSGDSKVDFYIESSDNAGNIAEKGDYEFTAIMPAGFPLWLLALIILMILAAIGATIYWARRRWKRATGGVVSTPIPR